MRLKLSLAFVLIASALSAGGTSQALAANETVLCMANQNPCTFGNQYESGTAFTMFSINSLFTSKVVTVECLSSTIGIKTTQRSGEPLLALVQELTFGNCTSSAYGACGVTALNLPYKFVLKFSSSPDGTTEIKQQGTNGVPGVRITCGLGTIKCKYASEPAGIFEGGNPAELSWGFTEMAVTASEGTAECVGGFWIASYNGNGSPTAIYVERN